MRSRTHYRITITLSTGLTFREHVAKRWDAARYQAELATYMALGLDGARDTARGHALRNRALRWDGIATMILDFAGMRLTFEPFAAEPA